MKIKDLVKRSIASNIRRARLDANMTQAEAAEKLGITAQAISNFERGVNNIESSMLLRMCEIYNVSITVITGEEDATVTDGQKETPLINEDQELTEYLEMLKTRPECRMLFQLSRNATKEDVEAAVRIIEALRNK